MASSRKTSNISLNQWDSTDPVLRTDFNDDNLKIDQAIGSVAIKKLADTTLNVSTSRIDIDLGAPLNTFSEVRVHLFDYGYVTGTVRTPAKILLQNRTSMYFENTFSGTNVNTFLAQFPMGIDTDKASMLVAKIYPGLGGQKAHKIVRCEQENYYVTSTNSFVISSSIGTHISADLTSVRTINIVTSIPIQICAGTRIVVFGMKV